MTDRARELLERVLAGMDRYGDIYPETLEEIRAYLAQPEQDEKPVAWGVKEKDGTRPWYLSDSKLICEGYARNYSHATSDGPSHRVVPLFLHPAPRKPFVRLTHDEVNSLMNRSLPSYELICAVENRLVEKNS